MRSASHGQREGSANPAANIFSIAWKNGEKFFHCVENWSTMARMKRALAFSFLVLGVTALVGQVLLVRELLIVFYGNEFFIGWTLFSWLFWVAAGALLAGRRCVAARDPARAVAICLLGGPLLLPAEIALIRASRILAGGVPGALPDLGVSLAFTFAALAPLCLVLGAQFVLGARAWQNRPGAAGLDRILGRAYALETAGFVAGGVAFSAALVVANEFRVAGWIGALNLAAAFALRAGAHRRRHVPWPALLTVAGAVAAVLGLAGPLDRETAAWRFPGQELVESRNSIHGNLAVTAIGSQRNFYGNGYLLGTMDEPLAAEPLTHFPLLWHPAPRRVLMLGGGFNGALDEVLKHAPERVDYLELDPMLVEMARPHLAPSRRAALADPRVNIVFADARFFLNHLAADGADTSYDVVIVNLPNPGTVLINRFYSLEFFREVRRQLAPGGVLAVRLAFAPDYLSRELDHLGTSIYRTLGEVFASVSILPEYEILYLATDAANVPAAADLVARYRARGLDTEFVIPPAIEYRMTTGRIQRVREAFEANHEARVNRDARPIACFYQFVLWLSTFQPRAAACARRAGDVSWPWAAGAAAGVVALMAWACRGRRAHRIGPWAMGIGSFSLMACEMSIILAFQVFYGYIYHQLALLISALMLGMAAGTALGTRILGRTGPWTLAGLHAGIAIYAAGWLAFTRFLGAGFLGRPAWIEWAFLALAAAIGGVVGFEFPVANRVYLGDGARGPRQGGAIYAVDLAGSCIGGLCIGLWALPVLGTGATLAILAALNAAVAILAATARSPESVRRPA